ELPDGTTFTGAHELAAALDEKQFAECMASKLYSYALGRSVEVSDRSHLNAIAQRAVEEELSLSELIGAIVTTPAFRAPAPEEKP
ncbi:MAG: DUF1585 domain-containing protein, partial [Myxococcales bacterium]|nr:DUF1585 domain-containing protein [Myxococcales bacterium]